MRCKLLLAAVLLASGLGAQNATAQCVGFTDTFDDVFCPAVEWLRNRGITTGCGGTDFCPTDAVTRLSMAQFMSRLGKALTPAVLHKEEWRNNVTVGSSPQVICETADFAIAAEGFPRRARFHASVWGHPNEPGQAAWLQGWWVVSTDAGTTWNPTGNWLVTQFMGRDWAGYAQVAGFPVLAPPMPLARGTTYRFGVAVNSAGSATYPFNPLVCQAEVTIENRNPDTSPLDE